MFIYTFILQRNHASHASIEAHLLSTHLPSGNDCYRFLLNMPFFFWVFQATNDGSFHSFLHVFHWNSEFSKQQMMIFHRKMSVYQRVNHHETPLSHHFPMVFLGFSRGYLRPWWPPVPRIYVHSGVATLLVADDGGPPLTLEAPWGKMRLVYHGFFEWIMGQNP